MSHAIRLQERCNALAELLYQLLLASKNRFQAQLQPLQRALYTELVRANPREKMRGFQNRLGRDAASVQTGPAKAISLDQRDA